MISILMLSWNRLSTLKSTLRHNLAECAHLYELLICDQGSDKEVIDELVSSNPDHLRLNKTNEGIAKSFNQLYLRSKGEFIALMSNDILWPDMWGYQTVNCLKCVPNSGLASINWGHHGTPPLSIKFGIEAHWLTKDLNRCFGPTIFRREVVNQIGLFHEGFGNYGIEDSDFNERVTRAGFNSFYIPGLYAHHLGVGEHDTGVYREEKSRVLLENSKIFDERVSRFDIDGIREPLPEMRPPL